MTPRKAAAGRGVWLFRSGAVCLASCERSWPAGLPPMSDCAISPVRMVWARSASAGLHMPSAHATVIAQRHLPETVMLQSPIA